MFALLVACDGPSEPTETGTTPADTAEDTAVHDTAAPDGPACRFPSGFAPVPDSRAVTLDGGPLHPWPTVSDPVVVREDGRYRMWFTTADWSGAGSAPWLATDLVLGSAYAESDDGIHWDDTWSAAGSPDHQVSVVLAPGDWDLHGVETPSVVRVGDDTLALYYTGDREGGPNYGIGLATSADGVVWDRVGDEATLSPELGWEEPVCIDEACTERLGGVLEPAVLVDPDGTLRMWYAAWGVDDGVFGTRMGYTTSADGASFDRHPEPVFAPGAPGAWDDAVVSHFTVAPDPVTGYHLFYYGMSLVDAEACQDCNFTPGWIGHAYSADGVGWERNPANPILRADDPDFSRWFLGGPSALFEDDGTVRLWYFTADDRQAATESRLVIELATGRCDR